MMFSASLSLFRGFCLEESAGELQIFSFQRKGDMCAETAVFIIVGIAGAVASLKQNLLTLSKTAIFTTTGIEG